MSRFPRMVEVAAICHVGRGRTNNEDRIVADAFVSDEPMYVPLVGKCVLNRPLLFAVADGVGGRKGGEHASRIAIDYLRQELNRLDAPDQVTAVLDEAHETVIAAAAQDPKLAGMATTVVGLVLRPGRLCWFNIGDSRLYRYRNGYLAQISGDDVPILEKRAATRENRSSSVISAALGSVKDNAGPVPQIMQEELPSDGCWLLCSDGLSDMIDRDQIELMLARPPLEAVNLLFDAAMRAGGHDNISIILVSLGEG